MSLFAELKRRHVFRVAAAYAVVAWILIQIADVISEPLALPEWFESVVIALLILGFPIAIVFAWAFDLSPTTSQEHAPAIGAAPRGGGIATLVVSAALGAALVALGGLTYWFMGSAAREARTYGIRELESLIDSSDWEQAYRKASEIADVIPDDATLSSMWRKFSWRTELRTEPAGARLYRRRYSDIDGEWEFLGDSPLHDFRLPFGMSVIRAELTDYETVYQLAGGSLHISEYLTDDVWTSKNFDLAPNTMRLDLLGRLPEGKVRIPGWQQSIADRTVTFNDYFLDRYEVSNEQYKAFVDAGGYEKPEFWEASMVVDGVEVDWSDGVATFVDQSGRPGPSTWIAGDYPDGKADHPVSGVSWYEAMAYARFAGQTLPTVHHWRRAYAPGALPWMIAHSNTEGTSTQPVGQNHGLSWAGNYDMAGNVREWTSNRTGDRRYILGGAWNDEHYLAGSRNFTLLPDNRLIGNGFRLAITRDSADTTNAATANVEIPGNIDLTKLQPISDDVFAAYKLLFDYEEKPLNPDVSVLAPDRIFEHELVDVDAAYPGSRLPIHIYLPTAAAEPFQAVIYWPGGLAQELLRYEDFKFQFDYLLKSGRAVAFPVYDNTFSRRSLGTDVQVTDTSRLREQYARQVKDFRRTLDYLQSRPDIDRDRIALFGNSWGARMGAISAAVDGRIRANILYTLPLTRQDLPDINVVNYLPRITAPTLMLNGEYDPLIPLEELGKPAFALLGAAADEKRMVTAPGAHFVPYDLLVRETLAWLDEHLGAPRRH